MHQCVEEQEWIPVKRPNVEKPSWSEGNVVFKNQTLENLSMREDAIRSLIKLSSNRINRRLKQVVRLAIHSSLTAPHTRTFYAPGSSTLDTIPYPREFGTHPSSCKHDLEIRNQDTLHDNRHLRIFYYDMRRYPGLAEVIEKNFFIRSDVVMQYTVPQHSFVRIGESNE